MIYTGRRYLNEICDLINYSPLILRHDYLNLKKKKKKKEKLLFFLYPSVMTSS